jgi:hypothetical protein
LRFNSLAKHGDLFQDFRQRQLHQSRGTDAVEDHSGNGLLMVFFGLHQLTATQLVSVAAFRQPGSFGFDFPDLAARFIPHFHPHAG